MTQDTHLTLRYTETIKWTESDTYEKTLTLGVEWLSDGLEQVLIWVVKLKGKEVKTAPSYLLNFPTCKIIKFFFLSDHTAALSSF